MKRLVLLIMPALVLISCGETKTQARTEERGMREIFSETLSAVMDSTASFSAKKAGDLLNELADTLQSVMDNSPLENVEERLTAQDMAGLAIFAALDYGYGKGISIDEVTGKFQKVISTWRTNESEKGFGYIKEIPFTIHKDTEEEEKRAMFIVSRTTVDPLTAVMLPQEATYGVKAIFANRLEDEVGYDFDNTVTMEPDRFDEGGDTVNCVFKGLSFMDEMMSHDALFIIYLAEDGGMETAMVNLSELHKLAKGRE